MAEVAVSMALQTLGGILKEEVKFLYRVSDQVKEMERQLREMQCLLQDADKRKSESALVANWISNMRDLAHRAEDVIEEYAFDISSKRGRGFKWIIRRFGGALKDCSAVHQIGSEILKIKSEFEAITKSMQEYGIRNVIHGESSTSMDDNQQWKRKTFPFENDEFFVGKEDELQQLVSLVSNEEQPKVISIWGMGGLGKTTIARKVYNHSDVKRSFKSFAWVCVTQNCQIRSLLIEILRQLRQKANEDVTKLSDGELVEQLRDIQSHERCLIVCDDVWGEDHWDELKCAFSVEGSRSKILLTTRKKNVADMGYAFELGFLTLDDGWKLLKKKARLCDTTSTVLANDEKDFEEIGKEMVERCGNLPLVISLLGGVLSKKNSKEEWKVVRSNIDVYLGGGESTEEKNGLQNVLSLSYDELPYYLKPCFLLMAQYGDILTIRAPWLFQSWIAQGMIVQNYHQRKDMTLMDVAELYLSELSSRCMVIVEVEKSVRKSTRICKVHDVVRDFCLSKVQLKHFQVNSVCYQGGKFSTLWNKTLSGAKMRYLTVDFKKDIEPEDGGYIKTDGSAVKYIRSLNLLNYSEEKVIEFPHNVVDLCRFKLLKQLLLGGLSFARGRLPKQIGYLIHLKSLYFLVCKMDELPSSIRNLTNLTFLVLDGTKNVRVPSVIKKMSQLKELWLPYYDTQMINNYRLALDGLDEMETLYGFNSLVNDVKSLITMKKMKRFDAEIHDNRSLSLFINTIAKDWKYLCSCCLTIYGGFQFTGTEDGKGLQILKSIFKFDCELVVKLRRYTGDRLQMCETELITSGLVHLSLQDCKIENDPMEILGKIPLLKKLELCNDSFLGEEMKCNSSGFLQLKKLILDGLPNLRQWNVEKGAMPHLFSIKICCCPRLKMIPDGLRFIKTLQKLKIVGIHQLERWVLSSSNSIREGEDYDKVRHVTSIIIEDQDEK